MKWGWALLLGVAAACSPHTVRPDPQPPVKVPEMYSEVVRSKAAAPPEDSAIEAVAAAGPGVGHDAGADVVEGTDQAAPGQVQSTRGKRRHWWQTFGDPTLNRVVGRALAGNFDVRAAWARLEQAAATAEIAGAPRSPSLDLALGATYQRLSPVRSGFGGVLDIYGGSATLQAGYELDVWAKLRSAERAAVLDREAAMDQAQVMAISIAAEVAEAYYDLIAARAQQRLLEQQLELNRSLLKVVEFRFGQGLATGVELNQQREQALSVRSAFPAAQAAEAVAWNRLGALLGTVALCSEPQAGSSGTTAPAKGCVRIPAEGELPEVPGVPRVGLPSELLRQRPDLRAAQRRVEAADHRLAAAVADRYPSLRLTGELSTQPNRFNQWLLAPLFTMAANLALPLLDGGQRRAEVERRRALMAEAVADYGTAVLEGIVEVDNALAQERLQREAISRVREQLEAARVTLQQAQLRYGQGTSDFISVLTALRSQQDVERTLLDARRQLTSFRIQLHRALGGSWAMNLLRDRAAREDQESL